MQREFGRQISGNRGRNSELSGLQRAGILSAVEAGESKASIATRFGCTRQTIYNTIHRWNNHETTKSLPRPGQPKKLTRRQERMLIRIARQHPRIEYAQLKADVAGVPVSKRTLYRLLKKYHITNWIAKKRPKLTPAHARARLQWARERRNFDFKSVTYSDEVSAERGKGHKRVWVFRTPSQKWNHEMIEETALGKDMVQMFWACFWYDGRSELVAMARDPQAGRNGYSARSYIWALEEGLLPILAEDTLYQMDNAPIHTAYDTTLWLNAMDIEVLEWPPYSPDLNPIEHLWWALKKKICELHPELESQGLREVDREAFIEAAQEAWQALPQDLMKTLIDSMPRRINAVIKARGWQTKY
jgi:transposase